jgi:hypothetical protein
MKKRFMWPLAALFALSMLGAACGDSDDATTTDEPATEEPTDDTTAEEPTDDTTAEDGEMEEGDMEEGDAEDGAADEGSDG